MHKERTNELIHQFSGPRCHRTNATYSQKRILMKKCDPKAFMLAREREMKKDRETETEKEEERERALHTTIGYFLCRIWGDTVTQC